MLYHAKEIQSIIRLTSLLPFSQLIVPSLRIHGVVVLNYAESREETGAQKAQTEKGPTQTAQEKTTQGEDEEDHA